MPEINIAGIDETLKMLDDVPKNVLMLGYARAATAAINVVAAEVVKRTPIGTKTTLKRPRASGKAFRDPTRTHLAQTLNLNVVVDQSAKGVSAYCGFAGDNATVAYALEYGHRQFTHQPAHRYVKDIPAKPFMRPAFDATAEEAILAFAKSIEATLSEEYE